MGCWLALWPRCVCVASTAVPGGGWRPSFPFGSLIWLPCGLQRQPAAPAPRADAHSTDPFPRGEDIGGNPSVGHVTVITLCLEMFEGHSICLRTILRDMWCYQKAIIT